MDDALKRLAVISGLMLVIALALLLPFVKWGTPKRPTNVPATAAFANGGKGSIYWIDCWSLAGAINRYSCTVYQTNSGEIVLKGIFQQTSITKPQPIFYDGSAIHWRHGQLLRPVQLQCVSLPQHANTPRAGDPSGGRPPLVADCKTANTRVN